MARFYSNENIALQVVMELRRLGHDVLTSKDAGNANSAVPRCWPLQVPGIAFCCRIIAGTSCNSTGSGLRATPELCCAHLIRTSPVKRNASTPLSRARLRCGTNRSA